MNFFTRITTSFLWVIILLPFASSAQINAPIGALPMQYISSFAGSNAGPRISSFAGYGTSPHLKIKGYDWYTSYDQFVPAIRSGIGITASLSGQNAPDRGYAPGYTYHGSAISVAVAPKLSILGKYNLSPSLNFSYSKAWDVPMGSMLATTQQNSNLSGLQSQAGILFNTHKFYIGYSIYIADKVMINHNSFNRLENRFNSYLQAGYTFQQSSASNFSFTPQVVFQISHDKKENISAIGLQAFNFNFRYKKFIWGFNSVGMRIGALNISGPNTGDIKIQELKNGSLQLGWQNDSIRIALTNNLDFLDRTDNSDTIHLTSLSFRYLIPSKLEKKYTVPGM